MKEESKTRDQLIYESLMLRKRIDELRAAESECKRAENALKESELRYRTLTESAHDFIFIVDNNGRITYANSYSAKEFGCSPKELVGKYLKEVFPAETLSHQEESLKMVFSEGKSVYQESRVSFPGRELWLGTWLIPLKDESGSVNSIMGLSRDITSQKEAEDRIINEKEFTLSLLNELRDGFAVISQDGEQLFVNKNLCRMTGYSAEELLGQRAPFVYWAEEGMKDAKEAFEKTLSGVEGEYQLIFKKKDGTRFTALVAPKKIMDTDGNTVYFTTVQDITEQLRSENELTYRIRLEKLITAISTKFINLGHGKIDEGLQSALEALGQFVGVDRSYIFLIRADENTADNTHEWCAEGIEHFMDKLKGLTSDSFPWMAKKIRNFEPVHVPRIQDMPPEAETEKRLFMNEDIQSLIIVPMVYRGMLRGFLGFDSVREEKMWTDDTISLLKIVGEIFVNALEHKRAEEERDILNAEILKSNTRLKQLALKDPQTGLYNHRYLGEVIDAEFDRARRYASNLSIIMMDIDYFKSINDTYGHEFGDLVLKQFTAQLKSMVRRYDIVIRYGGEEFVIISPGINASKALNLGQRLLDAIALYNFGNKKQTVKIKLSAGIASYPDDNIRKGMDLVNLADKVLNKVKEAGGNKAYTTFDIRTKGVKVPEKKVGDAADFKFLKEKISKLTRRANQSVIEAIFAFAKTIELKDHYTGEHVEKTVHYATEIAKAMNIQKEEFEYIRQAAILHDLGKIGISEKILHKPSRLTKKEFEEIKKHPQIGVDIIRPIQFMHDIIPLVLYHHERWDGKGYPTGLKGEEIPLGARIISIADAYQALTSDRPYRKAYSKKESIAIIKKDRGTHFDPQIVDVFLKILKREK